MASVAETAPAAAATATVSSSSIPRRNSGLSNAETKVLAGKLEEKYIANLVRSPRSRYYTYAHTTDTHFIVTCRPTKNRCCVVSVMQWVINKEVGNSHEMVKAFMMMSCVFPV
jgi:hypothetical protein